MGLKCFVRHHVRKEYDGIDVSRWNLEIEPFVAQ
jgi:hypothetical protein